MRAHPHDRLRLLLWLLLLVFGADQGVAPAEEIRAEGETGHAWAQHSGARLVALRLDPGLPTGAAALPAHGVEPPQPGACARTSPAAGPAELPLFRGAPRSAYPRGPPA